MNKQPQPETERDNDVVASLAVSLDGYVARLDGAVDFLEKYPLPDFDFDEWAERIGSLVMGRTSYQQLLEWGWLWGDPRHLFSPAPRIWQYLTAPTLPSGLPPPQKRLRSGQHGLRNDFGCLAAAMS
jgi:hypothetical protein